MKLTPKPAAKNPVTSLTIKRGGQVVKPVSQSLEAGGIGTFIFDYAPFAPTEDISFEMAGKARTVSCAIDKSVLSGMR